MSSGARVGHARFIDIAMKERRPVFWIDNGDPDVAYIPFGSFAPSKANLFVCLKLRAYRQTYHCEDLVLVECSERGSRELPIERQINPYSFGFAVDYTDRLRLGDYLGLAYTWLGRRFGVSHLQWHEKQKSFARRPRAEIRQAVEALVRRAEFCGLFAPDNYELKHIDLQLSRPRYEGPLKPSKVNQVNEWLINFVTWVITNEGPCIW